MDLPAQIGRYQILERIAQGGMADVFLARTFGAEGFEKRLVVKRIRPQLARSPRLVAMFINEARIAVSLNHPNIVQVYELNRSDSDWYIAMEHIHGRDLTRIRRTFEAQGRLLPMPLAVYAVASALRGLGYAHSLTDGDGNALGIVHGDMSPHNVVVSFTGEVKVVDFGIARLAGKGWGDDVERPGGGKFAYMSPEQVRGLELDRRTDIYSSGIVLYELLVGHRLFQHADPEEKLRRVREAVVPDPRRENPDLPDDLWDILQRALARDPQHRYRRAEAFEEDLRAFLFRHRLQSDATAMAAGLRGAFGEEALQDPGVGDLSRLADDLARLERAEPEEPAEPPGRAPTDGAHTGTPSWVPATTEELKTVTVVSVEISGDTDLTAQGDPSLLMDQERSRHRWFRKLTRRHGGLIQPGPGETLTVLFGVPRTREDDLERALRFALEMLSSQASAGWRHAEAALCVGVHQGEAAVQHAGGNAITRVVGRGDTLKLARRLAGHGELGQTLVSAAVRERAEDQFSFDQAPALAYRSQGRRSELPCFRLLGLRSTVAGSAGRWMVRGSELAILREALVALAQDEGRFVLLQGDVGVGKSRLVRELCELARKRHLPVYQARAYPFSDAPLAIYRDLVAAITGVTPEDAPAVIQRKLALLRQLRLAEADVAMVAWLFQLEQGTRPPRPSRDQLLEMARRLVRGLAEDGPVLIVLEDVHHLDGLERDVLHQLAEVARERALLLLASRAGPAPRDQRRRAAAEIKLGPLSEDALARLVAELLRVRELDPALLQLIASDTAGNPKYVLEMVKALERSGCIQRRGRRGVLRRLQQDVPIPHTLRGLFAARIDDLDPACKGVLQVAATIGMRIPIALLAECVGEEPLQAATDELVERRIWHRHDRARDANLVFSSEAFWEVVRGSVLGEQRRETHHLVSVGMLRLHAGDLEPHLEALARHEAIAGEWVEATRHLSQAGDIHRRREFLDRALNCFEAALGLYTDHRDQNAALPGVAAWNEISLHRRAGEVAHLLGQLRRAERYLQVALEEASEHGFQQEEAATCLALGKLCVDLSRWLEARAYLEQAREQADLLGDDDLALASLEAQGKLAMAEGEDEQAEQLYLSTLQRAGPTSAVAVRALLGLASHHIRRDELDEALQHLDDARERAESSGDRINLGRALNNVGIVHHARREWRLALDSFRRSLAIREGIGYRVGVIVNLHNIGDTHFRTGDTAQAYAAFAESQRLARDSGWKPGVTMNSVFLGYLDALKGQPQGLERLRRATHEARSAGDLPMLATGHWLLGRWHARQGDMAQAREAFDHAVHAAGDSGDSGLLREIRAARRRELGGEGEE